MVKYLLLGMVCLILFSSFGIASINIYGNDETDNTINLDEITESIVSFLGLIDTPSTYSGNAGNCLVVNSAAGGIEFIPCNATSGNSSNYWDNLDTPADILTGDLTDDNTYVEIAGDTMAGTLDMNSNLITNIGNAGTDFTTDGGLNLADNLRLDNQKKITSKDSNGVTRDIFFLASGDSVVFGNTNILDLRFHSGSTTDAMRIKNGTGYIGINKPAPTERLDIGGNLLVEGNASILENLNVTWNVSAESFLGSGANLHSVNYTETDPISIYKNGSSVTTAVIPFAQGLSIGKNKLLDMGDNSTIRLHSVFEGDNGSRINFFRDANGETQAEIFYQSANPETQYQGLMINATNTIHLTAGNFIIFDGVTWWKDDRGIRLGTGNFDLTDFRLYYNSSTSTVNFEPTIYEPNALLFNPTLKNTNHTFYGTSEIPILQLESGSNKVGIGTANPVTELEVNGSINATGKICDSVGCVGEGGGNVSFNQSYTDTLYAGIEWGYNMTQPFTDWLSSFVYNYNQTIPAISYTDAVVSANNASWTSTYNSSYVPYTGATQGLNLGANKFTNTGNISSNKIHLASVPAASSKEYALIRAEITSTFVPLGAYYMYFERAKLPSGTEEVFSFNNSFNLNTLDMIMKSGSIFTDENVKADGYVNTSKYCLYGESCIDNWGDLNQTINNYYNNYSVTSNLSKYCFSMTCGENANLDNDDWEWSCGGNGESGANLNVFPFVNGNITNIGLTCVDGTGTAQVNMTLNGAYTDCGVTSSTTSDMDSCNVVITETDGIQPKTYSDTGHSVCVVSFQICSWEN